MTRQKKPSPHTHCVVCGEERPDPRGPLPNDWQISGKADEMGGMTTHLTCSAPCRFLGGFEPSPFDR